jgi:hypothetical protein
MEEIQSCTGLWSWCDAGKNLLVGHGATGCSVFSQTIAVIKFSVLQDLAHHAFHGPKKNAHSPVSYGTPFGLYQFVYWRVSLFDP